MKLIFVLQVILTSSEVCRQTRPRNLLFSFCNKLWFQNLMCFVDTSLYTSVLWVNRILCKVAIRLLLCSELLFESLNIVTSSKTQNLCLLCQIIVSWNTSLRVILGLSEFIPLWVVIFFLCPHLTLLLSICHIDLHICAINDHFHHKCFWNVSKTLVLVGFLQCTNTV